MISRENSFLLGWVWQFYQESGAIIREIPCGRETWAWHSVLRVWGLAQSVRGSPAWAELCCGPRSSYQWPQRQVLKTIPRWAEVRGTKLGWEIFREDFGFGGWKDKYQWWGKKKSCSRNSWCVPLKCLFMALPWTVFSLYNVLALHSKIPSIASVTRILLEFDLLRKLAHYVIISCWILHSCMRKMHGNPSPPKIRF